MEISVLNSYKDEMCYSTQLALCLFGNDGGYVFGNVSYVMNKLEKKVQHSCSTHTHTQKHTHIPLSQLPVCQTHKYSFTRTLPQQYVYTHTRATPWLVGMNLGYCLFHTIQWRKDVLAKTRSGLPKVITFIQGRNGNIFNWTSSKTEISLTEVYPLTPLSPDQHICPSAVYICLPFKYRICSRKFCPRVYCAP